MAVMVIWVDQSSRSHSAPRKQLWKPRSEAVLGGSRGAPVVRRFCAEGLLQWQPSIGCQAIKQGHVVLDRSIFDVVRDFLHEEALSDDKVLAKYRKLDLLIVDMGIKQLPKQSGEYLIKNGTHLLDSKGACRAMYEKPIVDAFKAKTGRDPLTIPNDDEAWMRFRPDYNTNCVRRVRELIRSTNPNVQLGVMVRGIGHGGAQHKGNPYRESLLDVTTWAREGLIDLLIGDQWTSRQRTPDQLAEQVRLSISQVAGTKVPVALEMAIFDGGLDKIARGLPAVRDAGAEELALYQDSVLEDLTVQGDTNAWKQLGKIVASYQ